MPKLLPPDELDAIATLIEQSAQPLSVSDLADRLPGLPRRNLQRRLAALLADGRITTAGRGRATRYFPAECAVEASIVEQGKASDVADGQIRIALSAEAAELRQRISRPVLQRNPVGYQRHFLDRYIPNQSAYLPVELRSHLHELGADRTGTPIAGTYARRIVDRLLIDLSWNSSRLEGNTYSLLETQRLLEKGVSANGKDAAETQMILNHKAAIEFLLDGQDELTINRPTVLNLHAMLSDNLLADSSACGRLRRIPVSIGESVYHPPELPQLIGECFDSLLAKAEAITDPYEQGFFLMVHLPYLQAFEDVNKRVSRLAANIPLIRHNLCPLSFVDVPQQDYVQGLLAVYELNRTELLREVFVWACERSARRYAAIRQSLGEPDSFRLRHRDALRELIGQVITQAIGRADAPAFIRAWTSRNIADDEQQSFQIAAEDELMGLHEGNYARYRVRPAAFDMWWSQWNLVE